MVIDERQVFSKIKELALGISKSYPEETRAKFIADICDIMSNPVVVQTKNDDLLEPLFCEADREQHGK